MVCWYIRYIYERVSSLWDDCVLKIHLIFKGTIVPNIEALVVSKFLTATGVLIWIGNILPSASTDLAISRTTSCSIWIVNLLAIARKSRFMRKKWSSRGSNWKVGWLNQKQSVLFTPHSCCSLATHQKWLFNTFDKEVTSAVVKQFSCFVDSEFKEQKLVNVKVIASPSTCISACSDSAAKVQLLKEFPSFGNLLKLSALQCDLAIQPWLAIALPSYRGPLSYG